MNLFQRVRRDWPRPDSSDLVYLVLVTIAVTSVITLIVTSLITNAYTVHLRDQRIQQLNEQLEVERKARDVEGQRLNLVCEQVPEACRSFE